MLEGTDPQDIWNMDETALFWKVVSARTYKMDGKEGKNAKRSKDRLTITVTVSADGDTFDPQMLGKAACPRVLKGKQLTKIRCCV